MGTGFYKISATAAAYAIPKAGSDNKIAAGYIPDLSGTYAAASHNHAASAITSGTLALAQGGTGSNLSATGAGFLCQATTGANVTVSGIASADLTSALTTPPAIGGTTAAAISGTTGIFAQLAIGTSNPTNGRIRLVAPNSSPNGYVEIYGGSSFSTDPLIVTGAVYATSRIGILSQVLYEASTVGSKKQIEVQNWAGGRGYQKALTIAETDNAILVPLIAKGFTAQTANLQEWQNSAGEVLALVAASGAFTIKPTVANTVTAANVVTIGANSQGTPGADFGAGLLWTLESSTTPDRSAALDEAIWNTETDAGAIADRIVSAYYNAGGTLMKREGLRIRGGASATAIGFFGATPVAKPDLGAWAGLTDAQKLDALRDALSNLGLASYS